MSDDNLPIVENEHNVIRRGPPDNELDPQPTGCGASACCNPASGFHRFLALIFMCLLGFGKFCLLISIKKKSYTNYNKMFKNGTSICYKL